MAKNWLHFCESASIPRPMMHSVEFGAFSFLASRLLEAGVLDDDASFHAILAKERLLQVVVGGHPIPLLAVVLDILLHAGDTIKEAQPYRHGNTRWIQQGTTGNQVRYKTSCLQQNGSGISQ